MAVDVRSQDGLEPSDEGALVQYMQRAVWTRLAARHAGRQLSTARDHYLYAIERCRQARADLARFAYEQLAPALEKEWLDTRNRLNTDGESWPPQPWESAWQGYRSSWSDGWEGNDA